MDSGLPTDMPVGVVDRDMTATSRQLVRNLDAFEQTAVVARYPDISDARIAMQKGEIYGFYYIPEGTAAKAQAQRQPKVSFYTNNTLLIAGSLLFKDMKMMSELASGAAARTALYAKGATEEQAMAFLQPIPPPHENPRRCARRNARNRGGVRNPVYGDRGQFKPRRRNHGERY